MVLPDSTDAPISAEPEHALASVLATLLRSPQLHIAERRVLALTGSLWTVSVAACKTGEMILFVFLIVALVGPVVLGAVAVQQPRDLPQTVLMGIAILLPVLLAAALWFFERLAEHGGGLFGSTSDGDIGIWVAWQASVLLLPVSFGLACLGRKIGRR